MNTSPSFQIKDLVTDYFWKSKWLYALLSISFLWVFGGGDFTVLGWRSLISGVLICVLLKTEFSNHKAELLNFQSVKLPFLIALGSGIGFGILFHFSKTEVQSVILGGGPLSWFSHLAQDFISARSALTFLGLIPLTAAWAFVSRFVLQKDWGLGGVAFLDALTIGMGSQSAGLFVFCYLGGLFWGWLHAKFGFAFSFWTQLFSVLFLILSAWIFY